MIVELTKGYIAIVDSDDYEKVCGHNWCAIKQGDSGKVRAMTKIEGKTVYLHNFILETPAGLVIDHIDGQPLNNLKSNLRVCSTINNSRNIRHNKANTSGYKGVSYQNSKWRAYIVTSYKQIHLGCFSTKEAAAEAYNIAAKKYYGEFARLNVIKS
jgi:HNH endonuclease